MEISFDIGGSLCKIIIKNYKDILEFDLFQKETKIEIFNFIEINNL